MTSIRLARPSDAEVCGRIIQESFEKVHNDHGFPRSRGSGGPRQNVAERLIGSPGIYGVVAESSGRVVGCGFMDERDAIRGIGPLNVEPGSQERGIGRRLMLAMLKRAEGALGVRLLQDTFNPVSMALYTTLGFATREPMAQVTGRPRGRGPLDLEVRQMEQADLAKGDALCRRVHGFTRTNELKASLDTGGPWVASRRGKVTAYVSSVSWGRAHGVAATRDDMESLLVAISKKTGQDVTFLLPSRDSAFFRWSLENGLRIVKPMTLMSVGFYREPRGCYFPSIIY